MRRSIRRKRSSGGTVTARILNFCPVFFRRKKVRNCRKKNMQESERYEKADEACGNLSDAVDNLEEVISSIEAAIE